MLRLSWEIEKPLEQIVLRHLPSSREQEEPSDRPRAAGYANGLRLAARDSTSTFIVSPDVEELAKLQRYLQLASQSYRQLSQGTRIDLNRVRCDRQGEFPWVDENAFQSDLDWMTERVRKLRSWSEYRRVASKKRNWLAMSLTFECQIIWGTEKWIERNGLPPRDFSHIDAALAMSPKTQNHTRPGPFGRFVEDVFEVLEVRSRSGAVVSAASALDALRDFRCQE